MADEKVAGHPLDRQNEIERAIQLEGPKDPDNFKMPDGRSLTEVRQANQQAQEIEYQEEVKMVAQRTREQSIPELQKGEKLVMTSTGNLIDVTEPKESDTTITLAESRTTMANIEEGAIQPSREESGASSTAVTGETSNSAGSLTGSSPSVAGTTTAPSTPSPSAPTTSSTGSSSPGSTSPSSSGR